jgi:hypothetical protein
MEMLVILKGAKRTEESLYARIRGEAFAAPPVYSRIFNRKNIYASLG